MGLSNNERFEKIVYSIKNASKICKSSTNETLKVLGDLLWPTALASSGNSSFWLMGGAFDSPYMNEGLEALAFKHHSDSAKPKQEMFPPNTDKTLIDNWRSSETISEMLKKETLINDHAKSQILTLHGWVENYFYAVNRYDDEFSKENEKLSMVFAKIKAEIFEIIHEDEDYYRVWLLSNIIDKCFEPWNNGDHFLDTWMCDKNIHHDLRLSEEHTIEFLERIYFPLQKSKRKISDQERLLIILQLAGRRFHYEHKHKELLKRLNSNSKISIKKIKTQLNKNLKQYKIYQKNVSNKSYNRCALTGEPM